MCTGKVEARDAAKHPAVQKTDPTIKDSLTPNTEVRVLRIPGGSDGKASAYNAGDLGSIPESGRSPEEGNGNPLQYSHLGNPMNRGAWQTDTT